MSNTITAALSNTQHPEYGQVAVSFPIPDEQYNQTIEMLQAVELGFSVNRDCRVTGIDSRYSVLDALKDAMVNVDQLDYLAKRLDSFSVGEASQFEAMAHKLQMAHIKDFINLTFCCQQATVITDFSDLERIGKDHAMTRNGGGMPMDEYQAVDGRKEALQLIESGSGTITPYGVVYDNGMVLEPVYDGRHFPAYLYTMPLLMLEIASDNGSEYLYLPAPEHQLQRTLLRAGIGSAEDAPLQVVMDELPEEVSSILDLDHLRVSDLNVLNQLCRSLEQTQAGPVEQDQDLQMSPVMM